MIRRETRGSWIQKGKFIVLNSEESLTNDNGTVSEYYDSTKKDYELRLQGFYSSHPLQNVKIIVNGSMLFRTDVEGKVKLNFAIKSLHVMSDHQFYYKVKNENANNFLVKTEGINVQLIHFQNDTIIIKGNKLVFKNETYVRR
ncbi:MAG: hypothetical protein EOO46_21485 [Flavobacterium sp.]|nr:MAG: hypothetical protein EOO46_21485 [Flavobacterium sp.]